MSNEWRQIMAVLANPDTRRIAARLMLGQNLDAAAAEFAPAKRRRLLAAIGKSGLVDPLTGALNEAVFRQTLAVNAPRKQQGLERFLEGTRIKNYPSSPTQREELLTWVADRTFPYASALPEAEVNVRLRPFTEDTALLRRYLVDYGMLERSADGRKYWPTRQ